MKLPQLLCTLLYLFFISSGLNAQSIKGTVKDYEGKPVEFASVALYKFQDSSLIKGAISDENGQYLIENIPAGQYFLTLSMVGFTKVDSKKFDFNGENYIAEPLVFKKPDNELNAVTVTSTKPLIEVKADKLVMNVEGSINSTGLNALELLQKSPGVQVDKDDNILIKGKTGVRIYIDGRPSPMSGKDLASTLKSMNSADIEAIEIITNPSAKYDAAGDLGIINIRLKKNKKLGTNGNISLGTQFGITPKFNSSVSLNHREKKVNLFGSYGFNQGTWHNTTFDDQILNNIKYNKIWHGLWRDTSHSVKAGVDYFINDKNTVGFVMNSRISNHNGGGESETFIGHRWSEQTDSALLKSTTSSPEQNKNTNFNINYRFADTSGHELTVDADYGIFSSRSVGYQPNRYIFLSPVKESIDRNYVSKTPTDITIQSIKADYEQPLGKGKLGYGVKLSKVKSDNIFEFFNVINNVEIRDTGKSNNFTYNEKVYAAYLNYNIAFDKKWSLQAGIRGEKTYSLGNLVSYKQTALNKVDTNYLNFFPSGALSFQASKNHSFNLNYSRRINRPSYQDLNPFEYRVDELVYSKGNPFLRPEYANNFKLTHVFKGKLTSSVGYSRTTNPVVGLRIPYDSSRTYFIAENLDYSQSFNLDLSLSTSITKWWEVYYNISGYHNIWRAKLANNLIINNRTTAMNFYGQNTFQLGKGWSAELSGWYNSPYTRIDRNYAMGMMNIGVQKKFLKDNATLKVSFNDVFNTSNGGYESRYAGIYTHLRFDWEGQQLVVNFTYRFGSNEIKAARQRSTGSESELNRIKGN